MLILSFIAFLITQAVPQEQVSQVEFRTMTRGYQRSVVITADSVFDITTGSDERIIRRATDSTEWMAIQKTIAGIRLTDLMNLPSPSMSRASDAARHSTIIITNNAGKEYSHGFDNENPHDMLRPLMKQISSMISTEKTDR